MNADFMAELGKLLYSWFGCLDEQGIHDLRSAILPMIKRSTIFAIVKIAVAAGLIAYLLRSDQLELNTFKVYLDAPWLVVATICGWLFVLAMSSVRWWLLLRGIGIRSPLSKVTNLTLIGLFFNSVIPGAVGGDIIKLVYVLRDQPNSRRTPAALTILLDRIVGLMGLFIVAVIGMVFSGDALVEQPSLAPLVTFIYMLSGGTLAFFIVACFPESRLERRLRLRVENSNKRFIKIPYSIYAALTRYRKAPKELLLALLVAMMNQAIVMVFVRTLTFALNGSCVSWGVFAGIYPIGILVTALPLAPAGMGVGHVAFDQLYKLVGMANGANVFNIYVVTQILLNMTGAIPYLLMRRSAQEPGTIDAQAQESVGA